jgi:hypothetical protein
MSPEATPLPEVDAVALEAIETARQAAAEELLVTERGTSERRLQQKQYVVSVLARVEWDQAHGMPSDRVTYTSQLNGLYREGLQTAARQLGSVHQFGEMTASFGQWRNYVRAAIYPAIELQRGVESPQTLYELLQHLRSGAAWFQR